MTQKKKVTCAVCAWRATCNKKYSITDPSRCIDFSLDVTLDIPGEDEPEEKNKGDKQDKD